MVTIWSCRDLLMRVPSFLLLHSCVLTCDDGEEQRRAEKPRRENARTPLAGWRPSQDYEGPQRGNQSLESLLVGFGQWNTWLLQCTVVLVWTLISQDITVQAACYVKWPFSFCSAQNCYLWFNDVIQVEPVWVLYAQDAPHPNFSITHVVILMYIIQYTHGQGTNPHGREVKHN